MAAFPIKTLIGVVLASGLLIHFSGVADNSETGNCQLEHIANLLYPWADKIELEYGRMVEFEHLERDNPNHIDAWGDANVGDLLFEVVDEMRVYANECQNIND